jgi:beta-N-acetylhexosaminidase
VGCQRRSRAGVSSAVAAALQQPLRSPKLSLSLLLFSRTHGNAMIRRTPLLLLLTAATACARPTSPAAPAPAQPIDAAAITAAANARWVDETLARMTLRQKVGQLVMPRITVDYLATDSDEYERLRRWVQDLGVGGVVIHAGTPLVLGAKLNLLQRLADVPLLVTADLEPGPVQNAAMTRFPPAMGIAATGDPRLAWEVGRITAIEARAHGVHVTFAPVVDVNNNPDNPIINTRSYGEDPRRVAEFAVQHMRGLQQHGLLATAKHFPGHGNTSMDSHIDLPILAIDRTAAAQVELVPYTAVIPAGIGAVMTAHIAFPGLTGDTIPATLHPRLTTGLLREELGFRGVVFTDALDMGAIVQHYGSGQAAVMAVQAGADALLQPLPRDVPVIIDAVIAAVERGAVPIATIDASLRRILAVKYQLGLHRNRFTDLDRITDVVASRSHMSVAQQVAERSITVARDERSILPLDPARAPRVLSIVYTDEPEPRTGRVLQSELAARLRNMTTLSLDPRVTAQRLDSIATTAASYDVVIVSTFVSTRYLKGAVAITPHVAAWLDNLATRQSVVLASFGSPYVLAQFTRVGTYLLAWTGEEVAQRAAARALTGEIDVTGRLPINIPPHHRIGDGVRISRRDASTERDRL